MRIQAKQGGNTDIVTIVSKLKKIITSARTGSFSQAASDLNAVSQKLSLTFKQHSFSPGQLEKIAYSLETIVLMQKQDDWVAVADVIEYELIPLLQG